MKKSIILKKIFVLVLIVIINIVSFAAIVSDNDGASFITKAEIDALKASFQDQLNVYNSSIESKIDTAISSYLEGINTLDKKTKSFYDGLGSAVLVCKTSNINNLKRGYIGLNYLSLASFVAAITGSANSLWSVAIKRDIPTDIDKSFEVFRVGTSNVLEYYSNNWNCSVALTMACIRMESPAAYKIPTTVNLRWHGNNSAKSSGPTKTADADDSNRTKYATKLGYRNYMLFWGAGLNLGSFYPVAGNENTTYTLSSTNQDICRTMYTSAMTEKVDFDKITLLFDTTENGTSTNNWFSADMNAKNMNADTMTGYNNTNISFDLPSDNTIAPIETTGYVFMNGNNNGTDGEKAKDKISTNFVWTKNIGPTGQAGEYSWNPWIEPAPVLSSLKPSEITAGGVTTRMKNIYVEYGWTGKLTQGLPIDLFEKKGKVEFDLDLTPFQGKSGNLCVALSTTPFSFTSTKGIDDTTSSYISNLKIDGSVLTTGKTVFTNVAKTQHKIGFDFDMPTKTPVFIHIGWAKGYTGTDRIVLNLPDSYILTEK